MDVVKTFYTNQSSLILLHIANLDIYFSFRGKSMERTLNPEHEKTRKLQKSKSMEFLKAKLLSRKSSTKSQVQPALQVWILWKRSSFDSLRFWMRATLTQKKLRNWLRHILSRTHLISELLVLHFLSPWTNHPHKIDPPVQTVLAVSQFWTLI